MIEVKGLVKKYGLNTAVDHLSFSVGGNQIFGFLGPNGAGKSTTMNMMTGCLAPTEGEILIDGHNVQAEPKLVKSLIGYLPELPPVYMELTPKEYLFFVGEAKGISKKELPAAVQTVMEQTQITHMANRLIRNLSKGYRQRVGMAQAILGNPKVLILDEPTVGLDPMQIIEMRELVRSLGKDRTVIFSSHILSEVAEICDRVMIISHGKLIAIDTPENLSRHMQPQREVLVTIRVDMEDAAKQVLEKLENVTSIDRHQVEGEDTVDLTVHGGVRDEIAVSLMQISCPVLGMREQQTSLEDVFLELVEQSSTQEKQK